MYGRRVGETGMTSDTTCHSGIEPAAMMRSNGPALRNRRVNVQDFFSTPTIDYYTGGSLHTQGGLEKFAVA